MWRRAYLFLVLVRLYFALSPSYLHPDENFQGPEVIAGKSWWCDSFCSRNLQMYQHWKSLNLEKGLRSLMAASNATFSLELEFVTQMLIFLFCRPNLQLSSPTDLGIYCRWSNTKCLSIMACLRSADAPLAMVMDREWEWWRHTSDSSILDSASVDVCPQLRSGGLGTSWIGSVTATSTGCSAFGCVVICYLDIPDPYLFELDRDTGCGLESCFDS